MTCQMRQEQTFRSEVLSRIHRRKLHLGYLLLSVIPAVSQCINTYPTDSGPATRGWQLDQCRITIVNCVYHR